MTRRPIPAARPTPAVLPLLHVEDAAAWAAWLDVFAAAAATRSGE